MGGLQLGLRHPPDYVEPYSGFLAARAWRPFPHKDVIKADVRGAVIGGVGGLAAAGLAGAAAGAVGGGIASSTERITDYALDHFFWHLKPRRLAGQ